MSLIDCFRRSEFHPNQLIFREDVYIHAFRQVLACPGGETRWIRCIHSCTTRYMSCGCPNQISKAYSRLLVASVVTEA